MTVIVYSSKSGSSRKYAEILSSRTGIPVYPVGEQPDGESIVFFGWLRKDTVVGIDRVDKSMVVAVGAVGLDDDGRFSKSSVSDRNGIRVPIYYMRGWIDRKKLNILDKMVLLAVSVMMKLKGLNEHNKPVFDAMMEGGSFFDESYLDPLERFLASNGWDGSPVRVRTGVAGSKGRHD